MRKSIAIAAAAALLVATVGPSFARHYGHHPYHGYHHPHYYKKRNNTGVAIGAGILTLGIIAALASQDRRSHQPYAYHGGYYYPQYPQNPYHGYQQSYPQYQQPYGGYYGGYPQGSYPNVGQTYGYYPPNGQIVRCESKNYDTRYCHVGYGGRVDMYRKLSDASCYVGQDWGVNQGTIWVANGCRADFVVY